MFSIKNPCPLSSTLYPRPSPLRGPCPVLLEPPALGVRWHHYPWIAELVSRVGPTDLCRQGFIARGIPSTLRREHCGGRGRDARLSVGATEPQAFFPRTHLLTAALKGPGPQHSSYPPFLGGGARVCSPLTPEQPACYRPATCVLL